MENLLRAIISGLVEDTTAIQITEKEPNEEGVTVFKVTVAPADMGRIIGKEGKISKSIRTIMRAAAARNGNKVTVDIEDAQ